MTPVQTELCRAAGRRIVAVRPDLAARHDLTSPEGLLAAQDDIAAQDDTGQTTAVVVIHHVDLARWVRDTCAYAFGLDPDTASAWRRSFTRTVFLAGHPGRLRGRFDFAHIAEDGSAAWTAPGQADQSSLRRLLKLFEGRAAPPPAPDTVVELPGAGTGRPAAHRDLCLATAGRTVADTLVDLNHVLAEAVIDGLLAPGDRLTLRQVPRLTGEHGHLASVRIVFERPGRLMATAGLTQETPLV
ncbi:DUF6182 family protein [Streptomyces aurantiogriseus]|uniref:Uncharacterized protein n=1 Tax=Streptomyces aurantiogriseus TaxID=66870 RepID=A0A918C1L5_9ACTN|nr:DUF6182 family protein [Streptomyces aurantiogriseus]GGR02599.1 hypothetical protein GCM10010251_18000 [Streptomyces aurantiogriseus]